MHPINNTPIQVQVPSPFYAPSSPLPLASSTVSANASVVLRGSNSYYNNHSNNDNDLKALSSPIAATTNNSVTPSLTASTITNDRSRHHSSKHQQQQHHHLLLTHAMDHDHDQDSLNTFHFQGNNNTSSSSHGNGNSSNGHPHPSYHHSSAAQHQHHDFQQDLLSPTQQQQQQHHPFHSQQQQHHLHGGSHGDLQKAIPHQVDIYQQPPSSQPQDHELINPLMNRHLNNHASNLQSPHHHHPYQQQQQHHHHHPQQQQQGSPYYYQNQQQQQQQQKPYPDQQQQQQQHSDPATPASTAASTLTSSSTASTPSLSSPAPALPYQNSDYPYIGGNASAAVAAAAAVAALPHIHNNNNNNSNNTAKHTSPAAQSPFHVPATPTTPSVSHLTSPASAHPHLGAGGLPLAMPAWTTANASPSEQDMQPRQHPQQGHATPSPSHAHAQQQQSYQSARDIMHMNHLKGSGGGDRSSYYPAPQPSTHLYSQQGQDQHQQHHQHHAQMWVGGMSSDSFHSPQEFLEQPDRQSHKQPRPFTADGAGHPVHDSPYSPGGGYMGHGVPGHDRSRVQSARHSALTRNLMDYSDGYGAHGQGPSLAAQQAGMASMDGIPLLPPSHLMHADPQGGAFQPLLLNTAHPGNKTMTTSLDSVPMGLGPPQIMSHPDYGAAVASYMPAPTALQLSKARSPGGPGGVNRSLPPQRTQSAGGANMSKHHRARTSSVNSSSSIASTGIISSITSTLGATNISFTGSPSSISAASGNMNTTVIGTGTGASEDMDDGSITASSSFSSTPNSSKPRPGGHPRKAIAARVFECSFPGCNKAYTQLHNLKSHERTGHTPVQKPKPFLCIISGCTKAFSQRKSLALHIRASHKEYKFKPFKCLQQGCNKAYTQLHNLRTHEKTVHLLDLSRKRIRNPTPSGVSGGGSSGSTTTTTGSGSANHNVGGNGQQQQQHPLQYQYQQQQHQGHSSASYPRGHNNSINNNGGSSNGSVDHRGQFTPNVELSYESVDDLADYGVEMDGEGEEEEEEEEEEGERDEDGGEDNDDDYVDE